jgi:TRAP-type mannitol/chloroaromatic compound transport system permease large subunit
MSWIGLVLLAAAIAGITLSGLPAFVVLFIVGIGGALIGLAFGQFPLGLLTAMPLRVSALMENDLLQALPLYVLMGGLLNRLPVIDALFRTLVGLLPRRASAPLASGMLLGTFLGPMNGSVGASVVALSGTVAPQLERYGVPPATRTAAVVVASTLGIVVPPSLVLILLGDAMLAANSIAINVTGRSERAVNTQDIFLAALPSAGIFLLLCIVVAVLVGARVPTSHLAPVERPRARDVAIAIAAVGFVAALLAGVTLGYFYAVEAAAMGAVVLFAVGLATRRLDRLTLSAVLKEAMVTSGALFMLIVAANTLTLVFRAFGTDRLLDQLVSAIPGGELPATIVVLAMIGACAFALDAFEIIFFVIPIAIPPLLVRVDDAQWIAVLILLSLQASFLLPPIGYALIMTRGLLRQTAPLAAIVRALGPYLAAQAAVLLLVLAFPALVHITGGNSATALQGGPPPLTDQQLQDTLNKMLPAPSPPPSDDGPRF